MPAIAAKLSRRICMEPVKRRRKDLKQRAHLAASAAAADLVREAIRAGEEAVQKVKDFPCPSLSLSDFSF
jgi:hypothetical protein